jgi:O-antigen chain-terminating methyltransferase
LEDVKRKVEEVRSDLTATSIAGIGFEEMVRSAAAGRDAIARLSEQLELIQDRETSSQAEIRDLREEATKLHNAFHDSMVVNAELRRDFQILNTSYGATEAQVRGMREWLETLQRDLQSTVVDAELRRDFQILNTGYAATEAQVRGMQEWLEKIQQTLSDRTLPPALQEDLNEIGRMKQSLEQISNRTETLDERVVADGAFLKAQFALQQRQLDSLVSGRTGNGTTAQRTPKKELPADLVDHTYDAFYLAFEDRFRGTRAQIMKRMKVYLPFLKGSGWTKKGTRILDLGCGRGEWLELLRSSGYDKSQGVDLNSAMIQYCRERKLNVAEANALTFLAGAKTASFHAVTAYHLIEHLEFSALLNLASEAQRVLKPGGLVIFETPNPRNILVGASDFYRDMTHRNPIHPDTISFALETLGFTQVQVYFLADEKESRQAVPQEEFRFDDLAAYVDVPRDYAVVARTA